MTTLLVRQFDITTIVSDHCYGLVHPEIPSYFVTHQVQLPGKSGGIAQWIHRKWMQRFHGVWIMDNAENRLAGALSTPHPKGSYIGHYSRFSGLNRGSGGGIVGIISGPEPYAEQLFRQMVRLSDVKKLPLVLITAQTYNVQLPSTIRVINDWKRADEAILNADLIISRSGYTTLMDLLALEKKAVLLPTPGQTEQEYLATLHPSSDWKIVSQDEELLSLSF